MRVVKPITITPDKYSYFLIADDPSPVLIEWNSSTTYAANDEVGYLGFVYKALVAIAGSPENTNPTIDTTRWEKVRVKKQHAVFDNQTSSVAMLENGDYGVYSISPGLTPTSVVKLDTVGVFNVNGITRIKLTINSGMEMIYQEEVDLKTLEVGDWYDYFYEEPRYTSEVVFDNLPPALATNYEYVIEFFNDDYGTIPLEVLPTIGTIVMGKSVLIGQTQLGASAGILDYSRKVTDEFGNTEFVQRAFSKRVNCSVIIENASMNNIFSLFSQIRATPCLWIGTAYEEYGPLNVFGYYKDFNIDIAYPTQSLVSIEIEGLA